MSCARLAEKAPCARTRPQPTLYSSVWPKMTDGNVRGAPLVPPHVMRPIRPPTPADMWAEAESPSRNQSRIQTRFGAQTQKSSGSAHEVASHSLMSEAGAPQRTVLICSSSSSSSSSSNYHLRDSTEPCSRTSVGFNHQRDKRLRHPTPDDPWCEASPPSGRPMPA